MVVVEVAVVVADERERTRRRSIGWDCRFCPTTPDARRRGCCCLQKPSSSTTSRQTMRFSAPPPSSSSSYDICSAPITTNSLYLLRYAPPPELSLSTFKRRLKTQLFQHPWSTVRRRCDWSASSAPYTNIQTQHNSTQRRCRTIKVNKNRHRKVCDAWNTNW